jgi:glucose/arabinose dehydrogenase
LAFLPDGRMLVTERPGRLRIVAMDGTVSKPISGLPPIVARSQGGLLDVALDPAFTQNNLIYFTFSEPHPRDGDATSVARARLVPAAGADGGRLEDVRIIFRQQPAADGNMHYGGRIAIARDGRLFVTLGERYRLRDSAQTLDNHLGKVVRIAPDGTVPPDNPFVGKPGIAPEIWSYGHRNPQSAAIHPATGHLWTVEHGARGGDEINTPEPGKNYGWPVITYGRDYSGARIGIGTRKDGMEQPLYYWDPSIAPSGMVFHTGDRVPEWAGSLFVGSLVQTHLARLVLRDGQVVAEERLLTDLAERIRDVRQGPDGAIYVATDSPDGQILRVEPVR